MLPGFGIRGHRSTGDKTLNAASSLDRERPDLREGFIRSDLGPVTSARDPDGTAILS